MATAVLTHSEFWHPVHGHIREAITELAESKASDQTILGIAGHVSEKMLQHYSHVRMEAKRSALDALAMQPVQTRDSSEITRGYDTKKAADHRGHAASR
jgi:hypothetical protein